jgi:hypothetical protein
MVRFRTMVLTRVPSEGTEHARSAGFVQGLAASGLASRSTLSRIRSGSRSPSCASSMILTAMASLTPASPLSLRSWQTLKKASVMASVASGSNTDWSLKNGMILCMAHFLILTGIPQMTRRLDNKPRSIWPVWVGRAMGKDTHTLECASEEADGLG